MFKLKETILLLAKVGCVVLTTTIIIAGCSDKSSTDCDFETSIGIIRDATGPDNCGTYIIFFEQDNNFFVPNQLPNQFCIDGLLVRIKYRITEDKHHCGFGGWISVIEILEINKLN